jgi:hypothetical protein
MCVIVDTNCCHKVLRIPCDSDYQMVFDWINEGAGILIYGGKLAEEIDRDAKAKRLVANWKRAGKAHWCGADELADEENRIRQTGLMRSNDPHVLALAAVTRTRTLCTEDQLPVDDFKDHRLVPMSKCRVFRNSSHRKLLTHTPGCKGYASAKRTRR